MSASFQTANLMVAFEPVRVALATLDQATVDVRSLSVRLVQLDMEVDLQAMVAAASVAHLQLMVGIEGLSRLLHLARGSLLPAELATSTHTMDAVTATISLRPILIIRSLTAGELLWYQTTTAVIVV